MMCTTPRSFLASAMFGMIFSMSIEASMYAIHLAFMFEAQKSERKAFASVFRYPLSFIFFLTSSGRGIKAEWRR
uniref:Uncharacterized protein n=1 Tax=Arundo donax TaxID=35708 RepID=A0A0A9FMV3_ARUDO